MAYKFAYTSNITEWSTEYDTFEELVSSLYDELGYIDYKNTLLIYDLELKNLIYITDFFIRYDEYKYLTWENYCNIHELSSTTENNDEWLDKYDDEMTMREEEFIRKFTKEFEGYYEEVAKEKEEKGEE